MLRSRHRLTALVGVVGLALVLAPSTSARATDDQVIVPRGSSVQIAVVLDHSGALSPIGTSARHAIQMAVDTHALIRGFHVQVNDYDGPCGPGRLAENAAAAAAVVANTENVAVIGHMCSAGEAVALPIYEQADVVTLTGSANSPIIPTFGPDVFNGLLVRGPEDATWYPQVLALPSDMFWRERYRSEFGSDPLPFSDLYYDAASVMLDQIAAASTLDQGNLVIARSTLANAVRSMMDSPALGFKGVTCWINLDSQGFRVDDQAALDQCVETGNGH